MQPQLKSVPHEPGSKDRVAEALADVRAIAGGRQRHRRRLWRWATALVLPIAATGIWLGWFSQPVTVSLATAHVGPATMLIYATGFVEAAHPVSVSTRLTAPVVRVLVDEGDRVSRGQALALLEADQQRALLDQAHATALRASSDEQRALSLFAQGWSTRANRDAATAASQAANAAERSARAALDQLVIRAGAAGIVLKRDVEPGDLAVPGATLFELGDPHRLRVTATVDERDLPRLRVGQAALLTNEAWPNRILHGHVRQITPSGDPTQRAFRARLALDDVPELPFGMTLEVNIITSHEDRALLVPVEAVDRNRVWIMRNGRAYSRPVRIGIVGVRNIEVVQGLTQGQQVIVSPPAGLRDGQRVKVRG